MRTICGLEPKTVRQKEGSIKVYVAPSSSPYSNFIKNLMDRPGHRHKELLEGWGRDAPVPEYPSFV